MSQPALNSEKFAPLIDPFARKVEYLRVSVTDRCDYRCLYCMSEDMTFLPKKDLLSFEELDRICSAFIARGVRKLRLTGGEPLVRKDILSFIQHLGRHLKSGQLDELTLTTNGSQLSKMAAPLYEAGVRRINVSLDTLNPQKFKEITRLGIFDQVLQGLQAAKAAGLKIKINMVALKGFNIAEVPAMMQWCAEEGFDLTFIEVMPLGELGTIERSDQFYALEQLREDLRRFVTLEPLSYKTSGPARYFQVKETGQRLGFITPLTHNFCESCNRVRLTCTGMLYLCLGQEDHADLRKVLRDHEGHSEQQAMTALQQAITEAIARKPKGHDFIIERGQAPAVSRHMSTTGG